MQRKGRKKPPQKKQITTNSLKRCAEKELAMKALMIDCEYFYYPEDVNDFSSLQNFINDHYNSFVKMTKLSCDRTVPPFFVKEYAKDVYINLSEISTIEEVNINLMTKEDYKTSLNNAIDEVCVSCDNFVSQKKRCECGEIQENLCLNGKCELFTLEYEDYL